MFSWSATCNVIRILCSEKVLCWFLLFRKYSQFAQNSTAIVLLVEGRIYGRRDGIVGTVGWRPWIGCTAFQTLGHVLSSWAPSLILSRKFPFDNSSIYFAKYGVILSTSMIDKVMAKLMVSLFNLSTGCWARPWNRRNIIWSDAVWHWQCSSQPQPGSSTERQACTVSATPPIWPVRQFNESDLAIAKVALFLDLLSWTELISCPWKKGCQI